MKRLLAIFLMVFVFLFMFRFKTTAYAQNAVAEVANQSAPQVAVIGPGVVENAESFLKDLNSKIPLNIPTVVSGVFAFLIEMYLRFKPTAKPKSLLLLIASIFGLIGMIFTKLSGLADNFVQNIKDPIPPAQ